MTTFLTLKLGRAGLTAYRFQLWQRSPFCRFCGAGLAWNQTTLDHLLPRSRGGCNTPENLVLACRLCNGCKADRTLREWAIDILFGARPLTESGKPTATHPAHGARSVRLSETKGGPR